MTLLNGRLWVMLGVTACAALSAGSPARAETPYERDQREQLERYHQQHGISPQEQQMERWKQEWIQQHPGQPVPNLGVLEHLHEGEIIANTNAGFAKMWQARQAELQRQYQESRQRQERTLAAQHVTWSAQQWKDWDAAYDLQKQREAQDYIRAWNLSGQMAREEALQEQRRKELGY
jgi:hypothetical protein